eukprot:CAMPEP_0202374114 /NCGR_PEP_ID=MMETSP1127-20130417/5010_1 /ASSEMBLY_ACC=CAM_ASM_000462 /TAXON_ID=3047 /ORGANISM="Dunaliella tertiolecta, Strain CCMP1320" /LENGTH=114 /DNA_ID=CAMNT_0048971185 /DNA_START=204 /DNA_END=544 /DNA_ORIENTATION=+
MQAAPGKAAAHVLPTSSASSGATNSATNSASESATNSASSSAWCRSDSIQASSSSSGTLCESTSGCQRRQGCFFGKPASTEFPRHGGTADGCGCQIERPGLRVCIQGPAAAAAP